MRECSGWEERWRRDLRNGEITFTVREWLFGDILV
jgi:hypothetical protein